MTAIVAVAAFSPKTNRLCKHCLIDEIFQTCFNFTLFKLKENIIRERGEINKKERKRGR